MMKSLLLSLLTPIVYAYTRTSMDDERILAKPWYVRDIELGDTKIPISPVTLMAILIGLYFLIQTFTDRSFAEASHILVEDDPDQLEKLKRQIGNDPKKFATAAEKYSTCPSGKSNGGFLGKFKRGTMAPPFDRAVFSPKNSVEETIGPIQTHFGFHLIYIHRRRLEE
mmetsp:Transcript_5519/g.8005  ORF Transcript_5519/g.8005 Transcript_5519/m.8005 type:complete len:168 (+) Transcript_5519:37-540(+)